MIFNKLRCRLFATWGGSTSQGLGCSPIKAEHEMGSERKLIALTIIIIVLSIGLYRWIPLIPLGQYRGKILKNKHKYKIYKWWNISYGRFLRWQWLFMGITWSTKRLSLWLSNTNKYLFLSKNQTPLVSWLKKNFNRVLYVNEKMVCSNMELLVRHPSKQF